MTMNEVLRAYFKIPFVLSVAGRSSAKSKDRKLRVRNSWTSFLRQNNVTVTGFVLNNLMPRPAAYGYRKYGYAYSYKYSKQ